MAVLGLGRRESEVVRVDTVLRVNVPMNNVVPPHMWELKGGDEIKGV